MFPSLKVTLLFMVYLKTKRSVSVLKEYVKTAVSQAKARASPAAGSYKGKPGRNLDASSKDLKEPSKKVREVLSVRIHFNMTHTFQELRS